MDKMTEQERKEFEEFKQEKARQRAALEKAENIKTYKELTDDLINSCFPRLMEVSQLLTTGKQAIYESFRAALKLKEQLFEIKEDEQQTHTFTNKRGTRRIKLGYYVTDNYDDTVNEGIAKVKKYIQSLAKDEESSMLVSSILRLLSKDQQGNLKASRVMQLRKMADESGNESFIEGVKIISDAYQPQISKQFVRAEYKNDKGVWVSVALGMTEA